MDGSKKKMLAVTRGKTSDEEREELDVYDPILAD
jgi:hypothetical protein